MSAKREKAIAHYRAAGTFTDPPYLMVKAIFSNYYQDRVDPDDFKDYGNHCEFDTMKKGDICVLRLPSGMQWFVVRCTAHSQKVSARHFECVATGKKFRLDDAGLHLYRLPIRVREAAKLAAIAREGSFFSRDALETAMKNFL